MNTIYRVLYFDDITDWSDEGEDFGLYSSIQKATICAKKVADKKLTKGYGYEDCSESTCFDEPVTGIFYDFHYRVVRIVPIKIDEEIAE